jgi:hypothetical protein
VLSAAASTSRASKLSNQTSADADDDVIIVEPHASQLSCPNVTLDVPEQDAMVARSGRSDQYMCLSRVALQRHGRIKDRIIATRASQLKILRKRIHRFQSIQYAEIRNAKCRRTGSPTAIVMHDKIA